MKTRLTITLTTLLVALALTACGTGQPRTDSAKRNVQALVSTAEAALASAQAAGAPTFAAALYEEAVARLDHARQNWSSNRADLREEAALRAIEATYAAAAAEAQAHLVRTNTEIRQLGTQITSAGGTAPAVNLYDPPSTINRGATSMDRVIVAENAIRVARAAGASPTILADAERTLGTARTLARNHERSATADHLAYSAEMLARQAEYVARRNQIDPLLPSLRSTRARIVETNLTEEQRRRQQAEMEAANLRRQLDHATQSEAEFRLQLERDRAARIAAEQNLDLLLRRYETTLSERGASSAELEQLRREVEAQRASLRDVQNRERQSETSMGNQINTLEQELAKQRSEGRLTAEALAQRESELRAQREELRRLQREREASEERRLQVERERNAAIEQLQGELARAREELARRDATARQRIETMEAELAKLAATRRTDRGLIVTLPGVFFDSGQSVLKPGARNTLSKIADQLRVSDNARITIEGHTDSVGSDTMNQTLSEKRAAAVRDYLVSRGVPATQIESRGLGETTPVATNDTPAGRQQNRRVELIIAQ